MEIEMLPRGIWPVVLTPFHRDLSIDWDGYAALIEFYISQGSAGLFATCGSSETNQLTDDEIVALAETAVKLSAGRVPVVAGAIRFTDRQHQIQMAKRVWETGVQAVVLSTNQFADQEESDDVLESSIQTFADAIGDIRLGLYEYPIPYKRIIAPDMLGRLAGRGQFDFFKDTCCDAAMLKAKCLAVRDTSLRLYNADVLTLCDSLDAGCHGFCGTGTNFFFEPFHWMCSEARHDPEKRQQLDLFLPIFLNVVRRAYPSSAKMFLKHRGIAIEPYCRDWDRKTLSPCVEQIGQLMEQYTKLMGVLQSPAISV